MTLLNDGSDLLPWRDAEYRANPYKYYDQIRTAADVYYHPMGMYVIFKHEHISHLLRDRSLSVRQIDFGPASPLHDTMLGQDMPDHTRLRRATNAWFAPDAVQALKATIQAKLDELIAAAEANGGGIDGAMELAYPLTHSVMCSILDVPWDGSADIREKTFDFGNSLGPGASEEELVRTAEAADWFANYIRGLIAEKRRNPGEGMLDALIAMMDRGEMTEAEVVSTTFLFFAVGHLDVSYLIENGLRIMSERPDVLEAYRDDPEIRPQLINEILRFDTPEQFVSRLTTEPIMVGDVEIPAGEMLLLMIGAANKDPEVFDEPDEFKIGRTNSGRQLAFSGGIHGCVGQILARAEADAVFTTIANRFPKLRPDNDVVFGHTEFMRAIHKLPLKLSNN